MCSADKNHDYCIDPKTTIGFSIKLELNDSSTLLFFDKRDNEMKPFSLSKGGVYNPCPDCRGAPAPMIVPPAQFILEPFQRLSTDETTKILSNLTSEEKTELLSSPTEEKVKDFLIKKITPEELGTFIKKFNPEELALMFKSISKDDVLNRLGDQDRKAVSDKLSTFELTH